MGIVAGTTSGAGLRPEAGLWPAPSTKPPKTP